jgi:REP element-mobilizing transposase RayT
MAMERQKHPAVRLTADMQKVVVDALQCCSRDSDWRIAAASIEATHTHLLMTYTERDVDAVVKWLKDQLTKAIHRETPHTGPVWCKGKWLTFIFDESAWHNARRYIERHNERRGVGPRPYRFLS